MTIDPTGALVLLGRWLQGAGYGFTTVTPATHARINARAASKQATDLRGIFGWSRPFAPDLIPADMLRCLRNADLLDHTGSLLQSRVRFSSLGDQLYAHSAWPTTAADAVFFGPDTYRFAALIAEELALLPLPFRGVRAARILDMGCGSGAGGIEAALAAQGSTPDLVLADISPLALVHARANVELAGFTGVGFAQGDLFSGVQGQFDLIVANPPYLNDAAARTYRHGGGTLGSALSERIVAEGLPRLAPGGRLLLYTGAAMVDGHDPFLARLRLLLAQTSTSGWPFRYRELDPDVFGEELDSAAYAHAERIAAVALVVQRPGILAADVSAP